MGSSRGPSTIRYRFHHPVRSLMRWSVPSGDHSGWTIDSSGPPAARLASPRVPSGAKAATCRRVASHGMSGWSHSSQASIVPSGDTRGDETKSGPLTRTRGSPPSSGMVTIVLTGSPPPW